MLIKAIRKDFDKAEQFYLKAIEKGIVKAMHNYCLLLLEKNKINEALNQAANLFTNANEGYFTLDNSYAIHLVLEFMKYGQYHFLLKLFRQTNGLLMKYLQPVYYVLAWFMKDELQGEYEKAGGEIKETVDEMIKTVEAGKTLLQSRSIEERENP